MDEVTGVEPSVHGFWRAATGLFLFHAEEGG